MPGADAARDLALLVDAARAAGDTSRAGRGVGAVTAGSAKASSVGTVVAVRAGCAVAGRLSEDPGTRVLLLEAGPEDRNPWIHVPVGYYRTMFDPRNNLANDVSSQLLQFFSERVYRTVIPRNIRLAEAPSHGLPVVKVTIKALTAPMAIIPSTPRFRMPLPAPPSVMVGVEGPKPRVPVTVSVIFLVFAVGPLATHQVTL